MLAFIVRTLYLRNVPDPVARRLEVMASSEGLSVSALAVRELTRLARIAENGALLEALPDHPVCTEDVLADLRDLRRERSEAR